VKLVKLKRKTATAAAAVDLYYGQLKV